MKTIKQLQLLTMTRWSPTLNRQTSSSFDDEFNACVEIALAAAKEDKAIVAWAYGGRVAGLASIMNGQAELQVPLAKMLWEMWAERLLKLEVELLETNTAAARQAYLRLRGAIIAAQHYLDRPGWQQ
jgi:hypothetical protein